MHREGDPIDPLTVAWRIGRAGLAGPVIDSLLAVQATASQPQPDAVRSARLVLEQSVRGTLVETTSTLAALMDDVGPVRDTTAEAYARLNALWPNQRRLITASLSSTKS